jgi:hypothetical protein
MVPNPDQVGRLLTGLLGKPVQVKITKPGPVSPQAILYWGLYVDHEQRIRWACSCDLTCAANAGAALSVFPPAREKENITSGKLEPALEENLTEVLNILAQVLNISGQTHLRYQRMLVEKGQVPAEIRQGVQSKTAAAEFEVSVTGYGGGRLGFAQLPVAQATEVLSVAQET